MTADHVIAAQAAQHSVRLRRRVVGVSRAGDVAGRNRPPSARARSDQALTEPDRVDRAVASATIGAPDRDWLADSTSIPTPAGWCSLAIILDCFSRRAVGWALATHRQTGLVLAALRLALQGRWPAADLIHHRDRGCQYTSLAFGQQLRAGGLVASTGSVGDGHDHAVAESLFASLKGDLADRHQWPTRAAARAAIFESIEVWSNRQRRHFTLGYLSPMPFETRAQADIAAER